MLFATYQTPFATRYQLSTLFAGRVPLMAFRHLLAILLLTKRYLPFAAGCSPHASCHWFLPLFFLAISLFAVCHCHLLFATGRSPHVPCYRPLAASLLFCCSSSAICHLPFAIRCWLFALHILLTAFLPPLLLIFWVCHSLLATLVATPIRQIWPYSVPCIPSYAITPPTFTVSYVLPAALHGCMQMVAPSTCFGFLGITTSLSSASSTTCSAKQMSRR